MIGCFRGNPSYKKGSPEPLPKNFQERECWRGVIWHASVKHGLKRQLYKKGFPEENHFFLFSKELFPKATFVFAFNIDTGKLLYYNEGDDAIEVKFYPRGVKICLNP